MHTTGQCGCNANGASNTASSGCRRCGAEQRKERRNRVQAKVCRVWFPECTCLRVTITTLSHTTGRAKVWALREGLAGEPIEGRLPLFLAG